MVFLFPVLKSKKKKKEFWNGLESKICLLLKQWKLRIYFAILHISIRTTILKLQLVFEVEVIACKKGFLFSVEIALDIGPWNLYLQIRIMCWCKCQSQFVGFGALDILNFELDLPGSSFISVITYFPTIQQVKSN